MVYGCVGLDYRGWPVRWPPLMAGMMAGAEAARARFIFMDNLYMYGPVDGPLTEDLPLTTYGKKPAVLPPTTLVLSGRKPASKSGSDVQSALS